MADSDRALRVVAEDGGAGLLDARHLAELRASGLCDETIALARLYTESRAGKISAILGRKYDVKAQGSALVFPCFEADGSDSPIARIKPRNPRVITKKDGKRVRVKYEQRRDSGVVVYFEPRSILCKRYGDVSVPVVFTEGEKKALLLGQLGHCAVGLTGVWNWVDPASGGNGEGKLLHPSLSKHVPVAGRECLLFFDADSTTNANVDLAARHLAGRLLCDGASRVRFCCPPEGGPKGVDDYYAAHGDAGAQAVDALMSGAADVDRPINPKSPLQRVCDFKVLSSAPKSLSQLRVPSGYDIRRDGSLWQLSPDPRGDDKQIATGVILVSGYHSDLETGEYRVDIVFRGRENWSTITVDARAVVDRGTMLAELSPHLAPVTSNTAAQMIDWISAFRVANDDALPTRIVVRRFGWATIRGDRAFVLDVPLGRDGVVSGVSVDGRGDHGKMAESLRPQGTFEEHLKVLQSAWESSPTCATLICASLGAPLLQRLNAPNFGIHLAGDSSRGKTSMLVVAASVWGDPEPDGHFVSSWDATPVGAELKAARYSGLPLCFDEVGATDLRTLEKMVYLLINGAGRTRGTRDVQLREVLTWRSILLSTGEHPLASEQANTGAQVRVIQPNVVGFGDLGAAGVDALRRGACDNRGQVGRVWITAALSASPESWEESRRQFKSCVEHVRSLMPPGVLDQRQAVFFGFLMMIEILAHQVLGLGDRDGATIAAYAVTGAGERQQVLPLDERALDLVRDWVASEPATFPTLSPWGDSGDDELPLSVGASRLINGYLRAGAPLLIPSQLREKLSANGYSYTEVLRAWAARGWVERQGKNYGKMNRVVGSRLIELRWPEVSGEIE
jgi:hypothetical protein